MTDADIFNGYVSALKKKYDDLSGACIMLEVRLGLVTSSLSEAQLAIAAAESRNAELTAELETARDESSDLARQIDVSESMAERYRNEAAESSSALSETNRNLERCTAELARFKTDCEKQGALVAELREKLASYEREDTVKKKK